MEAPEVAALAMVYYIHNTGPQMFALDVGQAQGTVAPEEMNAAWRIRPTRALGQLDARTKLALVKIAIARYGAAASLELQRAVEQN